MSDAGNAEDTTPGAVSSSPRIDSAPSLKIVDLSTRYFGYFMYGGLIFLFAGLCLLLLAGFMSYGMEINGRLGAPLDMKVDPTILWTNLISAYLPILLTTLSAFLCTFVGTRLLRSSGVVATQVIAPQDYPLLGNAIASGNEQAINLFIRLSSLSGATGTFTKIGLTGLPLATIVLTILLAIGGLFNPNFFDLAKLTLGAFLGSFVQRQSDIGGRGTDIDANSRSNRSRNVAQNN